MYEVLLLYPRPARPLPRDFMAISPPLGIGYIASVLRENGINVRIIDQHAENISLKALEREIIAEKPKIIGLSVNSESYHNSVRIAKAVKECDQTIKVVMGGAHPTFTPIETLQNEEIDAVVIFEGEYTMLELSEQCIGERWEPSKIPGIVYRNQKGRVVFTPNRPLIKDLDTLPFPARDMFPLKKYFEPATMITSRGCPGECIFCISGIMGGREIRFMSAERVVREMNHINRVYGMRYIHFWDDTFTLNLPRLNRILDLIKKRKMDIAWSCGTRVDAVNKEIIQRMADAGCVKINFGVESGVETILKSIGKHITLEHAEKAVKWAARAGIYVTCSFMIPFPDDTKKTVEQTIAFAKKLMEFGVETSSFNLTVPFPGTYLHEKAEKLGIKLTTDNWDFYHFRKVTFSTKHLSEDDVRELFADAVIDKFLKDRRISVKKYSKLYSAVKDLPGYNLSFKDIQWRGENNDC